MRFCVNGGRTHRNENYLTYAKIRQKKDTKAPDEETDLDRDIHVRDIGACRNDRSAGTVVGGGVRTARGRAGRGDYSCYGSRIWRSFGSCTNRLRRR